MRSKWNGVPRPGNRFVSFVRAGEAKVRGWAREMISSVARAQTSQMGVLGARRGPNVLHRGVPGTLFGVSWAHRAAGARWIFGGCLAWCAVMFRGCFASVPLTMKIMMMMLMMIMMMMVMLRMTMMLMMMVG